MSYLFLKNYIQNISFWFCLGYSLQNLLPVPSYELKEIRVIRKPSKVVFKTEYGNMKKNIVNDMGTSKYF